MSLVVNTNISSSMVQRNLSNSTKSIETSIERLSTGFKINRGADDAAGLTISEGLKSLSRGSNVAKDNAQTGVNLLQTAEGDLSIIQDNLQRIRDLTVQAANGTYGTAERTAIQEEVGARISEIDRLAKNSKFNTINLLDGSNTTLSLQIGSDAVASLNALTIGGPFVKSTSTGLGIDGYATYYSTSAQAATFLTTLDTAISTVSTNRSKIGALQNRLDSAIQSLDIKVENLKSAESRIRDTNVAEEAASLTKNQILQQASASLLAQANQAPSIALNLI